MNRKKFFLIPTALLISIAVLFGARIIHNKDSVSATNDPIEYLINNSLSIQYGIGNIELSSVFTEEFIDNIDRNSHFYKKKLAPYQIIYKNYNLRKVAENEFTVSVHIEDKNGGYIQVIHVIKEGESYLIANIEYDI